MRKDLFGYFEFSQNFRFCTLSKIQILESPTSKGMVLILVTKTFRWALDRVKIFVFGTDSFAFSSLLLVNDIFTKTDIVNVFWKVDYTHNTKSQWFNNLLQEYWWSGADLVWEDFRRSDGTFEIVWSYRHILWNLFCNLAKWYRDIQNRNRTDPWCLF